MRAEPKPEDLVALIDHREKIALNLHPLQMEEP